MKKLHVLLITLVLVLFLFPGLAPGVPTSFYSARLTNNVLDDTGADIARSSDGHLHLVYTRGGYVYYREKTQAGWSAEETVGAGSGASVAVDPSGIPHVAHISSAGNSVLYLNRSGGSWSSPTTISSGNYVDLDVGTNGWVHVAYVNPWSDGDGYNEIFYTKNETGSFSSPLLLADGWYDYGSGNYFFNPSIKGDGAGYYHIVYEWQSWGGRASWSEKGVSVASNAGPGYGAGVGGVGWNTGIGVGKSAIALTASGSPRVIWSAGSTVYYAQITYPSTWSQSTLASGSNGSVDINRSTDNIGVAYDSGGQVYLSEDTGTGFGSAEAVATGTNPALVMGSAHIAYQANPGAGDEIYYASNEARPQVVVIPSNRDFGDVNVGDSLADSFSVSNDGQAALKVGTIYVGGTNPGDFTVLNDLASGETIPASGNRTFWVEFTPTAAGTRTASVYVSSNDPVNPLVNVPLYGKGVDTAAPVTTSETYPASAEGLDYWYRSNAYVGLHRSEPGTTAYQWDATSGAWGTYSTTLTVSEGDHTLYYYSYDTSSNTEAVKSARVKVDTYAPIKPALWTTDGHTQDAPSNDNTIGMALADATDAASGVDGFSATWDNTSAGLVAEVKNMEETVNATTSPPLADGVWWFLVRTVDNAGNWSGKQEIGPFTIDTSTPVTTAAVDPAVTDGDDGWYKTVPSVTLSRSSAGTTKYQWDSGTWETYSTTLTPAEGDHTLHYYSYDDANNTETARSVSTKVDVTPPLDPTTLVTSHTADSVSNDNTIDVSWLGATDLPSGVGGYSISWTPDVTATPDTTVDAGSAEYSATSDPLADGTWWVNLRTKDVAGNWTATVHTGPFFIDTVAPTTTLTSAVAGTAGWYTSQPWITLSATESSTTYFQWDSIAVAPGTYSMTLTAGEGTHTLYYYSVDTAGNTETVRDAAFKVDSQAPSANMSSAMAAYSASPTRLDVRWAGADPSPASGIATYSVQRGVNTSAPVPPPYWQTNVIYTAASFNPTDGATYTFRAMAADLAGNEGAWSGPKTVVVPYDQGVFGLRGRWSTVRHSGLYGGSAKASSVRGVYAAYRFTSAKEVYLLVTKKSTGGYADIYFGSSTRRAMRIDLYSRNAVRQVKVKIANYVRATTNKVKVAVAGLKNRSSKGTSVELDGIAVKR